MLLVDIDLRASDVTGQRQRLLTGQVVGFVGLVQTLPNDAMNSLRIVRTGREQIHQQHDSDVESR